MRNKYGAGTDPYCYPGTDTLRNLLDIRDQAELAIVEAELALTRAEQFDADLTQLNFGTFTDIHRWLFQDIYEWAGEIRTVDITKGVTRFCTASRILPEVAKLVASLESERWLESCEETLLPARLAHFYNEFNVLHPFRDGNGRAQRLFFEVIAANTGCGLSWVHISANEWVFANEQGYIGDMRYLHEIFRNALVTE